MRRFGWLMLLGLCGGSVAAGPNDPPKHPILESRSWGSLPITVIRLPTTASLRLLRTPSTLQPLATLATGIPIAINGGFFNRITQQPLGALRWQGEWWSSPILGRGVFAWTDQGETRITRMRWLGQVSSPGSPPVPVLTLNSGLAVPGVAAYNQAWGSHYTTQTDDEWVVVITQNRIAEIVPTLSAGSARFLLSPQQWLLTARTPLAWQQVQDLQVGSPVVWSEQIDPPELSSFPHILGAGPLLIEAGHIVLDAEWERFQRGFSQQQAARSALCLDTHLNLVTVGSSQETLGITLGELAALLQSWGCRDALNLDGGSSSALIWQGQVLQSGSRIHNGLGIQPSEP